MAVAEDPDDVEAAFEKAVRVLNAASQTSAGLRLKLKRAGFSGAAAEAACARAVALGYVNDTAYAEALVARRLRQGRGVSLIGRELGHKGLGEDVAAAAVSSIDPADELESATELALKLLRRHQGELDAKRREKVLSALARRGFRGHMSREAMARAGLRLNS